MSLQKKTLATTKKGGVGRKDYSKNIEYSVEKEIRSVQERFFFTNRYTALAGLTYPNCYETALTFLNGSLLQYEAPVTRPWLFYLFEATSDREVLCAVAVNRFLSYNDFLAGIVAENCGTALGYQDAKLEFTKGLPTIAGSVYSILFADFNGDAFNMDLVVHGLIGGVEALDE